MEFVYNPAFTISGFAVGLLVGLTGVGGGSLMTPLLVLFFGIRPATAVGTDLLYAALTKSGGTWFHHRLGTIDWGIVARLGAGSVPAAALTLVLLSRLGVHSQAASGVISLVLGAALLLTALSLVFRRHLLAWASRPGRAEPSERRATAATVATGALIGVLVSISSVGAGALGVTALTFLYPRLPALRVVGTDIAHAVPLTLVAGLGHWWLGSVDGLLLLSLLAGSLPGIALGSHLATRVPEGALRSGLATVLVLVGSKLLLA